ncbi:MAG: polysaccharide pyruvyl transferase family protein [Opitutaceae bacterium]
MPKPHLVVMGTLMTNTNCGVAALGASLVKLLSEQFPESDITLLVGNRDNRPARIHVDGTARTIPVVNFRAYPLSAPQQNIYIITVLAALYRLVPLRTVRRIIARCCHWIALVESAALVGDVRGGDSFSDIYGLKGFLIATLPIAAVIWVRGDITLFPQTYGPYRHPVARAIARYILRHARIVLSRDRTGLETTVRLGAAPERVRLCPDVAFALDPVPPAVARFEPPLPEAGRSRIVGVNVNALMYNGSPAQNRRFGMKLDYRDYLRKLLATLLDDPETRVLLIPHTFAPPDTIESDPVACRWARDELDEIRRDRAHLLTTSHDQHEVKSIIGRCNLFVGSRMHACIAALSQGIPTVGVAYSAKFHGVFETVGVANWVIDGRTVDADEALSRTLEVLAQGQACCAQLAERMRDVASSLRSNFSAIAISCAVAERGLMA